MKKLAVGLILFLSMALGAGPVTYTAKDRVSLQGKANRGVKIEIFVNNKKAAETHTNDRGEWTAYDVPLEVNAQNDVYAVSVGSDGRRSKTSTRLSIVVDTTAPQFTAVKLNPESVKPEDTVNISAQTGTNVSAVSVVLPDNATLELSGGSGRWSGVWRAPRLISGGSYKVLFTAVNKLGTAGQTQADLFVDAAASLLISAPQDGAVVYEEALNISGVARNSTQININGSVVAAQADGSFNTVYRLPKPGRNQLSISAGAAGGGAEQKLNVIRLITFPDIQTHWAKSEIEYLATLGYVQAYPNSGIFAPERHITRAELAALLVRSRQLPAAYLPYGQSSVFRDVQGASWATGYIETAARHGLVEGYPGHIYKPGNLVTRAEAAAMFARYAGLAAAPVYGSAYIDVSERHWGAGAIAALKNSGLIPQTWQSQRFYPDQPITRAEVAAILARTPDISKDIEALLGRNPGLAVSADPYQTFLPQPPASAPPVEAGAVLLAVASPREALPGNDITLTAAAMQKMRQVSAILPDQKELPMQYNPAIDLWEITWRVPAGFAGGQYQVVVKALAENGALLTARSNQFAITNSQQIARGYYAQPDSQSFGDTTVIYGSAYVYPEYAQSSVPAIPPAAGGSLTRAEAAIILAKYGYLKQAIVNAPPAKDVSLNHPQVKVIKSAIVTGIIPNKQPGQFFPNDRVSYADAAAILRRAKASGRVSAQSGYISSAEFDRLAAAR
ncbi:MAG: S-layer homology domain-containing protein [Candidatus Margulisbacteria bacterium]|jgi:hypothetical protein|nr:S-layer homology domain-containing protein [Candidatus Margulisiibacteriota bacterium]